MAEALTTIECSLPGASYALIETAPATYDVHLAGPTEHGTGPCLCGFDRFARDEMGRWVVGLSVGGGVTGPGYTHRPCDECKRLAGDRPIRGTHAALFTGATR